MKLFQSVQLGNDSVQIAYVPDGGVDPATAIAEVRLIEIPHAILPSHLMEDLVDSLEQIIEHARLARQQPEQSFIQPR